MHIHKDAYEITRSFTISAIFAIGQCAYIIEIVYELPVNDATASQLRRIFESVNTRVRRVAECFKISRGASLMTLLFIG